MLKDKYLEFAEGQAVTVSAATQNVVNRGVAISDEGTRTNGPYIVVQCREAALAAGAATMVFTLETSTTVNFAAPVVVYTSAAIAKADMTANKELLKFPWPANTKQYTRGYFTIATGPLTAGKFDVFTVAL